MQVLTNQTFLSRITPSIYNGKGRVVNIYGNTIKYNQLLDVESTHTANGVTVTNNGDGSVTLNGTSNSSGSLDTHQSVIAINDHKYAIIINTEPQNTYGLIVYSNITGTSGGYGSNVILNGSSGTRTVSLRTDNNVTYTNFTVYLMCIDLTALGMEDYTIAQVEQWLQDNFNTDYLPYTQGSLLSFKGTGFKTNGSTLPLPTLTYFPTGMKRVNDVYDEMTQSKAIKRYDMVDLGTLNWTKYDVTEGTLFRGVFSTIKVSPNSSYFPNILCPKYVTSTQAARANGTISQAILSQGVDIIDNDYTDAVSFKTAMSGVYLVYELATPVETDITWNSIFPIQIGDTEEIEGDTAPIICDLRYSSGVRDVIVHNVPVGGGSVSGTGMYLIGEVCTLVATPNQHYVVVNFELDDEVVTTEDTYTFEVE